MCLVAVQISWCFAKLHCNSPSVLCPIISLDLLETLHYIKLTVAAYSFSFTYLSLKPVFCQQLMSAALHRQYWKILQA